VLVDEIDQLITKKNDVIYNLFNWPTKPHSRLVIIAIANTMDLPEKHFSAKIRSRLGQDRLTFEAYDHEQLGEILEARLRGLDGVFDDNAVQLGARKIAAVLGDARKALDVCRRAIERVEHLTPPRPVSTADITATHRAMAEEGNKAHISRASLHQKILLWAVSRVVRAKGVPEVKLGDVRVAVHSCSRSSRQVMFTHGQFVSHNGIEPAPSQADLFAVVGSLAAMRLVTTESARLDCFQRIKLEVSDTNLQVALGADPELGERFTWAAATV